MWKKSKIAKKLIVCLDKSIQRKIYKVAMPVRKYEKTTNYKFCEIRKKDKKEKDSNNSSTTSDLWNSRNRNYDKNDISNNLNVNVNSMNYKYKRKPRKNGQIK